MHPPIVVLNRIRAARVTPLPKAEAVLYWLGHVSPHVRYICLGPEGVLALLWGEAALVPVGIWYSTIMSLHTGEYQ